ncbi:MAG: NAD(P)/FAD-dependent oxidoreductase [Chitinophagales bacterium]|nr:NAD(P)/FAD-dependent oxidoreductase [Chitinophagales bacterium]MDW8274272.1 NAD(P)/FAD-dependent oxidoreductase [Chitinophagales bacterium]
MHIKIETDILIIGAGPAGLAASLYLAYHGVSCVVAEKNSFPRDKICGDALSGKVLEALKKIDSSLVDSLKDAPFALPSYGVTFVAPSGRSLRLPFKPTNSSHQHAPGFISKRLDFDKFLFDKAKQLSEITILEQTEVRKYHRITRGFVAEDKKGNTYTARLIIAADGAYSSFTKDIAGLQSLPQHYCYGLRAYCKGITDLDDENFIELHFIREALPGYFWIFPLPGGAANVGIGMRADVLKKKKVNLKKLFFRLIAEHPALKQRFNHAEFTETVKLYGLPLGSIKRPISGHHYMLCGDAAMLIDPFTGEGIGNALLSGIFAAQQAIHCLRTNNFSAQAMKGYDEKVYQRLGRELTLSYRLQQLVRHPWLFNLVVDKANKKDELRELMMSMFEDVQVRSKLKNPMFYLKMLF